MDTTVILLVVCLTLIAITLIMMIGFCCMFRAYLRRRPDRDRYKPSYNLETVYTNTRENQGFTPEKKNVETHNAKEAKKSDGNKNEINANT